MKTRKKILIAGLALALVVSMATTASAAGVLFVKDNRVSIGTDTPTAPLDVNIGSDPPGTGNAVLRLERAGDLAFQLKNTNDGVNFWQFASASGGGEFRIAKSGSGVGFTLTPSGNLTLAGSIFTSDCSPCVSDYVFEGDWELMPLEELEEFVWANHHLPNVPSQKDVDEAGRLDLVSMQMKMLEKIEELTLYTIEQHKKIQALEGRLAEMEQ